MNELSVHPIPLLQLQRKPWFKDGHLLAMWTVESQGLIKQTMLQLYAKLKPFLEPCCTHMKGNGGVKGTVRWLMAHLENFQFVARFDVVSYYQSIYHHLLLQQLGEIRVDKKLREVVRDYLQVPDTEEKGRGMVAGGSLSPLLGALYLLPLDYAMQEHTVKSAVFYVRYMDDLLILAKKRWHLRKAIKKMYCITETLGLVLHQQEKCLIGRIEKGFDFLGYHFHPGRKLRPSAESLRRLLVRASRLYEQKDDLDNLWLYVRRWVGWLRGGLSGLVSLLGGRKKYWVYVLKRLKACDLKQNQKCYK